MNILAIDPGTNFGFSIWLDGEDKPRIGSENLNKGGVDKIEDSYERMVTKANKFREWLVAMLKGHRIEYVAVESRIGGGGAQTDVASIWLDWMFLAVGEVCSKFNIPCKPVPIGTWRASFLSGLKRPKEVRAKGKLSAFLKKETRKKCDEFGWNVTNNDQSDSAGICYWLKLNTDPSYAATSTPLFEGLAS